MAAKVSPRVQDLVEAAAELLPDDLAALIEAIQSLPRQAQTVHERHALIEERVVRVQSGHVATLTLEEVEQSVRRDLDF